MPGRENEKAKEHGKNLKQFFKFGLVGLSNTFISEAVYAVIVCLKGHYLAASATGFVLSIFNAYYWNNRYVFREDADLEKRVWWKVLFKTFIAYLWGFLANLALLALWIDLLHIAKYMEPAVQLLRQWGFLFLDADILGSLLAEGINLVLVLPMNYLLNKRWAYRQEAIQK
ncbi:MAG: GtrA family protein [Lachnospiraceae bacterium]|nr:GtrA family protein [Lachnospiraceae bacterium]